VFQVETSSLLEVNNSFVARSEDLKMAGYKEYFTVEYRNDQRVVVLNDTLKPPTRKNNEQDNSTERSSSMESRRNIPLL
tara:strand:+ start:112 stop:348 length:237 start_codon:yes stop_codon:yes gene_type:complete